MCFSKYFSIPKMVEFHRKISYMQLICGLLTNCVSCTQLFVCLYLSQTCLYMFNDNKVIIIIINKSGILYPFVYKAKTARHIRITY